MKVRAKFKVLHVSTTDYGPHLQKHSLVTMGAQYDPAITEDQSFAKATPSGELKMVVDNPAAQTVFQPGRDFYLDFTPAD